MAVQASSGSAAIAALTAAFAGTVTANAVAADRGDHGGVVGGVHPHDDGPVAPQAPAVLTVCAARLAAPRAEGAFPPRSLVAAATGADSGVLTAPISAFSPRTSTDLPWIFACPNFAPSFL
jgi:hypothetical protein